MIRFILFITCYLVSQSIIAQSPKIGVVDKNTILNHSAVYQWINNKTTVYADSLHQLIKQEQKNGQDYLNYIIRLSQCGEVSPAQEKIWEQELLDRQNALAKMVSTSDSLLQDVQSKLQKQVQNTLHQIISQVCTKESYDLILDKKGVIYHKEKERNALLNKTISEQMQQSYNLTTWNIQTRPFWRQIILQVRAKSYYGNKK
jgi:Skp family chaperone for outer membrane proteins